MEKFNVVNLFIYMVLTLILILCVYYGLLTIYNFITRKPVYYCNTLERKPRPYDEEGNFCTLCVEDGKCENG